MHRREFVRALGATTGVTLTAALAGCSDSGGSGGGPFSATAEGPYAHPVNPNYTIIYARLTVENPPSEWPEEGYYSAWTGTKGNDDAEAMSVMYEDWEETNYRFEQSDFEDGPVTINALMDEKENLDSGTTVVFEVNPPDTEEYSTLAEVTYEGDPEQRELEPRPTESE